MKAVVYIHGKGGSPAEAAHYAALFPGYDMLGFDYRAASPREAREEFSAYFSALSERYDALTVIANSIGAYYLTCAENLPAIENAFFLSPVVDLERLILDLLAGAGATEKDLKRAGRIDTPFGETMVYRDLLFLREHPVLWQVPTHILYGECDALVRYDSVKAFAARWGATLDVMPQGEHWFHTDEQMAFVDRVIQKYTAKA